MASNSVAGIVALKEDRLVTNGGGRLLLSGKKQKYFSIATANVFLVC